jgi:excinuclease ABC subunit C
MENQAFRATLLERARETSQSPGVYLMKDEQGAILYVGKAKNLKNRLQTYFQAGPHPSARTDMMVARVNRFDVILTETEAEALILECTLIKKHKPKFNVRLKDDKTYPYLKISLDEPFPRIQWTRRVKKGENARYFGPFPSAWSARQVLNLLNHTYRLRDCSDNTFRHRSRPCILFQMGKCSAPCVGKVAAEDYRRTLDEVTAVLEGKSSRLLEELKRGMADAAEREEYEQAASFRDQIRSLELVTSTQVVDDPGSAKDRDVVGLARSNTDAHGVILQIRNGRLIAARHYHLQNTDPTLEDAQILFDFLAQYYLMQEAAADAADLAGTEAPPGHGMARPKEVLLPEAPSDSELLERTIGVGVRTKDSPADEQLLNVARSNAQYALEQAVQKNAGHGVQALEEVQSKLHLGKLPHRIECYDISNFHGQDSVASRVVFIDGAPDKNLYRRYKIRTVEGANDFASMKEVLGRRFAHAGAGSVGGGRSQDEQLPDLVVVDGGKGQLSQAVAILEELGVQGVDVVGLAKARVESDFQSSEVKSSHERIFIPGRKNPVPLLPHMQSYKLLTHVRDEAHRFAIGYHRLLRDKRSLRSESG